MRRTTVSALAIAAALAAAARAADLDAGEKAWVAQCVANLASKSGRVRAGAESAIGAMGFEALPSVLDAVGAAKGETDWHALSLAIAAMGPGASKALADLRPSWPKYTETQLGGVVDEVRSLEEKAARAKAPRSDVPASPEDVEAAVMAILATYEGAHEIRSPDPQEAQIVKLGRPAIGVLVRVIRDPKWQGEWAVREKARAALAALVGDEDAPMLAALVREGRVEAEAAFANLNAPASVELLAGLIRDGLFDTHIESVLRGKLEKPAIVAACCDWLANPHYDGDIDFAIAEMASVVGGGTAGGLPSDVSLLDGTKRTPGMADAIPPLVHLLERDLRLDARRRVASALVRLGEKAGIPVLIDVMTEKKRAHDFGDWDYDRHTAGEQLNDVSGTKAYEGRVVRPEAGGETRWEGNFAEAAKAFRAWWSKAKDKIRYDDAAGKWVQ
jgi:hypothetical protein